MDKKTLRKAQLVQLEIAKEIKRVCEENGIQYFLDSGSLLGAVRHKGFIPWDDDMDLGMLRKEYERFLQIAPTALNEKYELVEWKTESKYPYPFAKVMRKGTIYQEEAHNDFSKCGIFVDIFPYDRLCPNQKQNEKYRKKLILYRGMIRAKCHHRTWTMHNHFYFGRWLKNLPYYLLAIFYKKEKLIENYEKIATIHNEQPFERFYVQGGGNYLTWQIPRECLENLSELTFEGNVFSVPENYDLYLKTAYGDYMQLPPEHKRENIHSIIKIDFGDALSDEGEII